MRLSRYRQLLELANAHAVTPLLRERVLAQGDPRHPGCAALHDEALREAALEARRNARLARTLATLAAAGVPALVFKGTALAHRHYARPELRPRDDTDLLIDRRHLDAAHAVLVREGHVHVPALEGSLIMRQRLYRHVDADGVTGNLDVHWAVTNDPRAGAFDPRALMAASEPLPALSPHARAPGDVVSLLLACLHLDAHHPGDVRLIWLCDVDRLVRALDREARVRLCALAREHRLEAPCAWVLGAARDALATPLDGFEALLASASGRPPASSRRALWLRDLSRLSGTGERVRWIAQHLFPPVDQLRRQPASSGPAWQLYARRTLRGVGQLFRR